MEGFKSHRILSLSLVSLFIHCAVPVAGAVEPAPTGRILIRAGHVLDVHSGKETADQTIVVTGGIITGIAATSVTFKQPSDREIDLTSMTVLPGLIDVHTHLTGKPTSIPITICRPVCDPLQDVKLLQHVAFVMKSGKVFKNESQ